LQQGLSLPDELGNDAPNRPYINWFAILFDL
jgi:hypothetical protein